MSIMVKWTCDGCGTVEWDGQSETPPDGWTQGAARGDLCGTCQRLARTKQRPCPTCGRFIKPSRHHAIIPNHNTAAGEHCRGSLKQIP